MTTFKPRIHEQFFCDSFYMTNLFDRVDGTTGYFSVAQSLVRQEWTAGIRRNTAGLLSRLRKS